jgi:hypothetical protein
MSDPRPGGPRVVQLYAYVYIVLQYFARHVENIRICIILFSQPRRRFDHTTKYNTVVQCITEPSG